MLLETIRSQRDAVLALAAQYGASNLRVFGSVARGEETPDSDIDIVADFAPGQSYADLWSLQDALEDMFGRKVDLISQPGIKRIADWIEDDIIQV